jgi:shikimate kinase
VPDADGTHIVIVGAMGSGKTTVGTRVAAALGRPFVDNDARLAQVTGSSAAEIAARDGADALHRAEAASLLDALGSAVPSVIAAAASTIADDGVRSALSRSALVVWLRADPAVLVSRMPGSATRPFRERDPARLVAEQARERDHWFGAVADVTVDTGREPVDRVVARVLASADERGLGV